MGAAHCLITYTAFFDTVRTSFPEVWELISSADINDINNVQTREVESPIGKDTNGKLIENWLKEGPKIDLTEVRVPTPHPAYGVRIDRISVNIYNGIHSCTYRIPHENFSLKYTCH